MHSSINRGQQQLAREFPEAVGVDSQRQADGRRPLWCFLANRDRNLKRKSWYWEKQYRQSVAVQYGVGISAFTRWTSNVEVKSLNKYQVQRKFGKLIINKTSGYAACWLYRLLMRNCLNNEQ